MAKAATATKRGRSKDGVNKAQLVRDAFAKLGIDASAKDVQAECDAHGVTIAPAQISNIRTKIKEGKKPGRRGAKAGGSSNGITADELIQARVMADKVGGVARAKELLDVLQQLL
ncbi:MAG: hypothetical protein JNK76_10265 [Planctomycetales bacterium]|jgi:hypothetical protein|nr:hypothetical protein [Planctomycetales bacterium]MBN8626878.1 hypothetical protein [Planctomycetota bacterium]